ncbi:hypothetical protein [Aeromonas phage Riv-10]|nr:hypothetical protein [Aeromonas phage Riv-10]
MKIQFKSEQHFADYCAAWWSNSGISDYMPDGVESIITVDRLDEIMGDFFWDIGVDPQDGLACHTISYDEHHFFNIIEK